MIYLPNSIERVKALGGYQIVYADPCWQYKQQGRGAATKHYKTMSLEQIKALPIAEIAAKDAVLFIWGTWPNLFMVEPVMNSWGFSFKTLGFLWTKTYAKSGKTFWGGGHWTRANSEFCLLGVRGDIRRVDAGVHQLVEEWEEQGDLVLRAPVGEHSAKPAEVRDRIFKLMGDRPAIELFARHRVDGWDGWGNEIPGGSDILMGDSTADSMGGNISEKFAVTDRKIVDVNGVAGVEDSSQQTPLDLPIKLNADVNTDLSIKLNADADKNTDDIVTEPIDQLSDQAIYQLIEKLSTQEKYNLANLPKELADEVGKARTTGGGNYIVHGLYTMMIKKWFYQKSPTGDRCIILEMVPVESAKKVVYHGQEKVEQEPNAVGSECSTVANFDGAGKQSAPGNSRAPVLGLFGFKENEVPDAKVSETLDYCVSDVQPAAGMLLTCSTFPKEIRSRKGEYITGLTWECINRPGEGVNHPTMVKARIEALAAGPEAAAKVAITHLQMTRGTTTTATATSIPGSPTTTAPAVVAPAVTTTTTMIAPSLPPSIPTTTAPPIQVIDPFAGWEPHPDEKGKPEPTWFWNRGTNTVKSRADLLAGR